MIRQLGVSTQRRFWKTFPEVEPRLDLHFSVEDIEMKDVLIKAKEGEQVAPLEKESFSKDTMTSSPQLVTEEESVPETLKTVNPQLKKQS